MKAEILIEEIYSAGARLVIDGPDIIIERPGGPLSDHLIDELRQHKAEVISALKEGQTGDHLEAGECSEIIPGKERYPWKFVGDRVLPLLFFGANPHRLSVQLPEGVPNYSRPDRLILRAVQV